MKHPHCNRSHAAHLFWCRGFAPVVFILAIALVVVAIGSGIYFSLNDKAHAPSPADGAAMQAGKASGFGDIQQPNVVVITPSTTVATTVPSKVVPGATISAAKPTVSSALGVSSDCGSNVTVVNQCLASHLRTCAPAKGTVVDPKTGLRVERIIDGYKGDKCSYRTNILSGSGRFAILAGMDVNCLLPKSLLSVATKEGSVSSEDMLTYCTGSFVDFMRAQGGAAQ